MAFWKTRIRKRPRDKTRSSTKLGGPLLPGFARSWNLSGMQCWSTSLGGFHAPCWDLAFDSAVRSSSLCPRRSAAGRRRPALHHGVLLQGAVGTSAGVSAALLEEPLPAAQENRREWPHAFSED